MLPAQRAPVALQAPVGVDALILGVAILAVCTSGPLVAACAAPSLAIAMWRNAMASGVIVPWALWRRRAELAPLRGRPGVHAMAGGVLLAGHFGTWIPSLSLTSVASSTALVATQPVWNALLARRSAPLHRRAWVGIGVAIAGAVLITGVDVSVSHRALEGDLLALVGGMLAAAYMTVGGVARQTLTTTAYTTVCYSACAALLAIACVVGGQRMVGFSGHDWLLLVALTVGPQLLGHSMFNRVLRTTSPTVVSLAILLEVPGAGLLAWAWLGQTPHLLALPGLLLLLVGLALVVRSGRGR